MSENLCDDCKYINQDSNNRPCSSCLKWVDGYLEATNYEYEFCPMRENKIKEEY